MGADLGISDNVIILGSAILAALSFVLFALPFLNRQDQRERYRGVIEKKRKALFEQNIQATESRKVSAGTSVSAKDSLANVYRVQTLFGKTGKKLRDQMLQAGIRDPKAPMYYLVAQLAVPFILFLFGLLILSKQEDPSQMFRMGLMLGLPFAGLLLPRLLVKNYIIKRQEEINLTFPNALDMMLICVQGGIGMEQAVDRVAEETAEYAPVLAEELGILSAEMGMLNDRRQALQDFSRRVGSGAARSFATAMIQAEQYGTSVSQAMRVISDDLRDQRMQEAERKAAALPPKLTVPMILFFLPALFVVILCPAFLQASAAGVGQ